MIDIGQLRVKVFADSTALDALSLSLTGIATASVKTAAEVSKNMVLAKETFGATAQEAEMLNKAMMDAAAQSVFTTQDASNALLNFSRAGLQAAEAADALAPAMNLAAGEGGNLDTVSQGLVATINGFSDSFDKTAEYADIFAAACNNSALEINSLTSSISVAAPVFASAGYSIEDLTTYMGAMGDKGIDASRAANSLKTGLGKLVSPTDTAAAAMERLGIEMTNADGSMKDAIELQEMLYNSFANLTEEEQINAAATIFGKNQMSNWLALIQTAPSDFQRLNREISNSSGTTDKMAKAMQSGLGGSIEAFKSSVNALSTEMGELMGERIQPFIENLTELTDALRGSSEFSKNFAIDIGEDIIAVTALSSILPKVVEGINKIKTAATYLMANPMIAAIGATVAATTLLIQATKEHAKAVQKEVEEMHPEVEAYQDVKEEAEATAKSIKELIEAQNLEVKAAKSNIATAKGLISSYKAAERHYAASEEQKQILEELIQIYPELNQYRDESTGLLSTETDYVDIMIDKYGKLNEREKLIGKNIELEKQKTELLEKQAEAVDAVNESRKALWELEDIGDNGEVEHYTAQWSYLNNTVLDGQEAVKEYSRQIQEIDAQMVSTQEEIDGINVTITEFNQKLEDNTEEVKQNISANDEWKFSHDQEWLEAYADEVQHLTDKFENLRTEINLDEASNKGNIQSLDDLSSRLDTQLSSAERLSEAWDKYQIAKKALALSPEESTALDDTIGSLDDVGSKINVLEGFADAAPADRQAIVDQIIEVGKQASENETKMNKDLEEAFTTYNRTVDQGFSDILSTMDDNWRTSYEKAKAAGMTDGGAYVEELKRQFATPIMGPEIIPRQYSSYYVDGSHADGLPYVPKDGYIAELHKGERVLTAEENEKYSAGGDTYVQTYNITVPENDNAMETALKLRDLTRKEEYGYEY